MVAKKPMLTFRESRRVKRQLIHYPAWLLLDSKSKPLECVIRDMSDGGARLAITPPIKALPRRFVLWLDEGGKVQRQCEIVWADGGHVGVRFLTRS